MVSTYFASLLGGFSTFFEILLTAFIGIFLLKNFKYSLMANIKELTRGEITQEEFVKKNIANAIGAVFLIIPGFLTDILGILLQFGFITFILTKLFSFKIQPNQEREQNTYTQTNFTYKKRRDNDDEIIDVEVIDDYKSIRN